MLQVKTPQEVLELIKTEFEPVGAGETVPLYQAVGRVLSEDVAAEE